MVHSVCLSRVDLENAYGGGGMVVLECVGKSPKILSQVFLCLEVDSETHMPGDQVCLFCVSYFSNCFGGVLGPYFALFISSVPPTYFGHNPAVLKLLSITPSCSMLSALLSLRSVAEFCRFVFYFFMLCQNVRLFCLDFAEL